MDCVEVPVFDAIQIEGRGDFGFDNGSGLIETGLCAGCPLRGPGRGKEDFIVTGWTRKLCLRELLWIFQNQHNNRLDGCGTV